MAKVDPVVNIDHHFALGRSDIEKLDSVVGACDVFVDVIYKLSGI